MVVLINLGKITLLIQFIYCKDQYRIFTKDIKYLMMVEFQYTFLCNIITFYSSLLLPTNILYLPSADYWRKFHSQGVQPNFFGLHVSKSITIQWKNSNSLDDSNIYVLWDKNLHFWQLFLYFHWILQKAEYQ